MTDLPPFLYRYFWDTDPKAVDVEKNATAILERIIEMGTAQVIQWMLKEYDPSYIAQTLKTRRGFSPRSAWLFAELLHTPKEELLCMKGPYRSMQKQLWNF